MMGVADASKHACVSESLIRLWIKEGRLPHFRVGAKGKRGKILIEVEDLDGLMASFKVSGPAAKPAPQPKPVTPTYRHLNLPS